MAQMTPLDNTTPYPIAQGDSWLVRLPNGVGFNDFLNNVTLSNVTNEAVRISYYADTTDPAPTLAWYAKGDLQWIERLNPPMIKPAAIAKPSSIPTATISVK